MVAAIALGVPQIATARDYTGGWICGHGSEEFALLMGGRDYKVGRPVAKTSASQVWTESGEWSYDVYPVFKPASGKLAELGATWGVYDPGRAPHLRWYRGDDRVNPVITCRMSH